MKKILILVLLSISLMGCASLPDTKNSATPNPAAADQSKPASTDPTSQDATKSTSSSSGSDTAKDSSNSKQDTTKSSNSTSTSSNTTDSKTTDVVKIVNVSTPAPRNSTVTVTAKVSPHATAQITVNDGKGTSNIAGLEAHKADANGTVSWSWHISEKETIGVESVKVTSNGASAASKFTVIQ
ncbi:hypothetical protein [Ectobacillus sp. sgz5001026]|uniref:hypothetical protein n=1 Tax=Ectobacillus sp. sgz5001026 TaxID=3242473 RepID=UPI0036D3840A